MNTRSPMPCLDDFIAEILDACVTYAPSRARDVLEEAVAALGLGGCIDDVLFPAMREIGSRWQLGRLEIEAERLTTEVVRGWLEGLTLRAPEPFEAAPLLLTCGPADLHSIGLEALAVLLRHHRRPCRVLGTKTSVRTLTTAVRANRPSAVVIASHLRNNRASAAMAVRAAASLGPEVFYAGDAFGSARLRRHVPGTYLDTTLQGACTLILASPPVRAVPG